jgi:hypothetical protein
MPAYQGERHVGDGYGMYQVAYHPRVSRRRLFLIWKRMRYVQVLASITNLTFWPTGCSIHRATLEHHIIRNR